MKKLIIYFLVIILSLPLMTSCEDFLDSQSYTQKDASTFPRTQQDVEEMMTGVYAVLSQMQNNGRNIEQSYFYVGELASDERFGGGGMNDFDFQALGHMMYVNPDFFNSGWVDRYLGIARANEALVAMVNFPDGDLKEQKIGELKTLRAIFYFELVQLLGDVPIVRAAPANVQAAVDVPPQSSQAEVFKLIATDLWEAYNQMSDRAWNYYPSGTMTKWAAGSLLARVYLFYTGFYRTGLDPWAQPENPSAPVLQSMPREGGEITKQNVIDILNSVINDSGHDLVNYYQQNWPYTNPATKSNYPYAKNLPADNVWVRDGVNKESVLVIKCVSNQGAYRNALNLYFGLRQGSRVWPNSFPLGRGWGSGAVNPKMWDEWISYEADDTRRVASIFHFEEEGFTDENGNPTDYLFGMETQYEESGLWQKKYMAFQARRAGNAERTWICWEFSPDSEGGYGFNLNHSSFQNGNGTDIKIIRFADVLLMHSELTETATGINRVRKRANPGWVDVGYSEELLRNERRFELAFEGTRWTDIRRWHIATQALPNKYGGMIYNIDDKTTMREQSPGGLAERYRQTKGFWMKPQTQLRLAPDGLTQNPGWETPDARYSFWRKNL